MKTRSVQSTRDSRGVRVRRLLVDSPASVGAKMRSRRWDLFHDYFPDLERMRVVDLGGTVTAWQRAPVRPAHVTVLNLFEPGTAEVDDWLTPVTGDACYATDALAAADEPTAYDLVFSNSLLEHVGGHAKRRELAAEIRGLAPCHWVQTPYRYFPVEPHWLFPGMQFFPVALRAKIAKSWPMAHTRASSEAIAISNVMWTELIGATEMQTYFPDSAIVREKMAGLTKSLIAIRS